ncbi:MAG: hypothetical protein ACK53Y_25145, partial [bacterium]
MHYKSLTPDNFVPPLLHMEMGMVNQVWEDFENWIDDKVELIPIEEKLARTTLDESRERLLIASSEKDDAKKNISIELKQTNAEIKARNRQVKIRGIAADAQQELHARVTLLTALLEEQKNTEKQIVRNFKDAQEAHKNAKKALEDMKAARGKPESSISVD